MILIEATQRVSWVLQQAQGSGMNREGWTPELKTMKQVDADVVVMAAGTAGFGSLSGIKINYKTEVLNKEHGVILGLYAAGTDANTIYGDAYIFILPGNTMGFAINSGRMAGENAAEFVLGEWG